MSTLWESRLWESTISDHRFGIWKCTLIGPGIYILEVYSLGLPILDLAAHMPGSLHSGSLHPGSLHPGSLESRATDFGSGSAHAWESTIWESTPLGV